jgi:hypothetical protein
MVATVVALTSDGEKNKKPVVLLIPHLDHAETVRTVLSGIVASELGDLIRENITILGNPAFLNYPVEAPPPRSPWENPSPFPPFYCLDF